MTKRKITNKLTETINKAGFKLQKHSPEILLVCGAVGAVVSAVVACRATLKVDVIMSDVEEKMNKIHEAEETGHTETGLEYSKEDAKKDTALVYAQTGMKLAKLYAPAAAIGAISLTSIFASNNILKKRNVAITAAYAAIDQSFKDYRGRVIERFGKDIDKELKYNLKSEETTEEVTDETTGEKKEMTKTNFVVKPSDISGYARFFEKYTQDDDGNCILNPHWDPNNEYNLMFIKAQERYANDLLISKKRLFLNEVYRMLGLPETKAGQVVGWVYNPDHPIGDNYVDFGLYSDNLSYSDFVNGCEPAILLDFNVDGNIWELM